MYIVLLQNSRENVSFGSRVTSKSLCVFVPRFASVLYASSCSVSPPPASASSRSFLMLGIVLQKNPGTRACLPGAACFPTGCMGARCRIEYFAKNFMSRIGMILSGIAKEFKENHRYARHKVFCETLDASSCAHALRRTSVAPGRQAQVPGTCFA